MPYNLYKVSVKDYGYESGFKEKIEYEYGDSAEDAMTRVLEKYGTSIKVTKVQGMKSRADLLEAAGNNKGA